MVSRAPTPSSSRRSSATPRELWSPACSTAKKFSELPFKNSSLRGLLARDDGEAAPQAGTKWPLRTSTQGLLGHDLNPLAAIGVRGTRSYPPPAAGAHATDARKSDDR